jgi:hypothetical protein
MQVGLIIIGTLSLFAGLGFAAGYLTAKREFEVGEETDNETDRRR